MLDTICTDYPSQLTLLKSTINRPNIGPCFKSLTMPFYYNNEDVI